MGSLALNKSDYYAVAQIHAERISQGFLSSLGLPFLALLYEAIDIDSSSVLFVEKTGDAIIGFVAGGHGMGSIYRTMLRRWWILVPAILPSLVNPARLRRIIEIVWFGRKAKPVPDCPKAELFSIAVLESAAGTGVAQRLYSNLSEHFTAAGDTAFCIVVGKGLEPAHQFYRKRGAIPIGEVGVHSGEPSTLYRQSLPLDS